MQWPLHSLERLGKEHPMTDGVQYATSRCAPRNRNKNKHGLCRHDDINRLRDLFFSQNQPLNSASD